MYLVQLMFFQKKILWKKVLKRGFSPFALIALSALCGVIAYGV